MHPPLSPPDEPSTQQVAVQVTTDDVSHVKHSTLQHLPVFQYNDGGDDEQDSQLINSVYLDNSSLELYHGRLDKRPNALALRIR